MSQKKILRYFLEILSINQLKNINSEKEKLYVKKERILNHNLSKFLYREVGRDYSWTDRLSWTDQEWENLVSSTNYQLFTLYYNFDLAGYYEIIFDEDKNFEIAYLGIFKQYFGKKIGSFLLSSAIQNSFNQGAKRVWVHTCTLDHPNALKNYLARGMKIFKHEEINLIKGKIANILKI